MILSWEFAVCRGNYFQKINLKHYLEMSSWAQANFLWDEEWIEQKARSEATKGSPIGYRYLSLNKVTLFRNGYRKTNNFYRHEIPLVPRAFKNAPPMTRFWKFASQISHCDIFSARGWHRGGAVLRCFVVIVSFVCTHFVKSNPPIN